MNNNTILLLIDSPAPTALPKIMSDSEIIEYLVKYGLTNLSINLNILKSFTDVEAKMDYIEQKGKGKGSALEHLTNKEFMKTWQAHSNTMHKYVPSSYNGKIVFFSHSEVIEEFPTNQYLHCAPLAKQGLQNYYVPGNHISINSKPYVEEMAKKLYEIITKESKLRVS